MVGYFVVGLVALAISFTATPVVRWLSIRVGAIDKPNDRKVHADPTPTLGGLALALGVLGALVAAYFLPDFRGKFVNSSEILGLGAGAIVIFFLGAVDDLHDLPAPVKLAGQIFAAGTVFLSGVQMKWLLLPGQTIALSEDISVLLTIGWLVLMINAVNLVDGLDGLAAGIVSIAAASFFVYTIRLENQDYLNPEIASAPLIAIIIVGATLGFLRHNFHPARIFMGDSGAMLLGLLLGGATVAGIGTQGVAPEASTSDVFLAYFPLLIPLAVIAIPLLDVAFAIMRRARRRRSVVQADKEHLHHRLMDLGHGHRQAVIVMYIWSALAAGAGLAFSFLDRDEVIFALPIAVGALVLYTLFPMLTRVIQERTRP